ncbi:MAG: RING finger domain-containing protein [Candidatus Helarchaeota archaeon]
MERQIISKSKNIYIISVFAIIWEVIDLFLINFYVNPYYNFLKYAVIFSIIIIFITILNKYAIILFLEVIPILNYIPLFIGFSIFAILYMKFKIYKYNLRPKIDYTQLSEIKSDEIYCPNCGIKIVRRLNKCPNCGNELGLSKYQCPICRTEKREELIECPSCNTRFHKRCFLEWIKIKGTCPICKNYVDLLR